MQQINEILTNHGASPEQRKCIQLTRDADGKVIQVAIAVNKKEEREILDNFQDKQTNWKEAAPHYILLQAVAGYHKTKRTELAEDLKEERSDQLAGLVRDLSRATAPLYSLVNHPDLDAPNHPDHEAWEVFKAEAEQAKDGEEKKEEGTAQPANQDALKIKFLQSRLTAYDKQVKDLISTYNPTKNSPIANLLSYHTEQFEKLERHLKIISENATHDTVRKLFSNQAESWDHDSVFTLDGKEKNFPSLGSFLRDQAHQLGSKSIAALDEFQPRFDQLFSSTAHPLRKKLVKAKSDLSKQLTTYAARYLNKDSPIPPGQLAALKKLSKEDQASTEKRWLDITPYVKQKEMLGKGPDGSEGLDDIDQLICFYTDSECLLTKPKTRWARVFSGEDGGGTLFLALLGVLFGTIPFVAFTLVALLFAMIADLVLFAIRCVPIVFSLILVVPATLCDFFFRTSLLKKLSQVQFVGDGYDKRFRELSRVRKIKQILLNRYNAYTVERKKMDESLLDETTDSDIGLSRYHPSHKRQEDQQNNAFDDALRNSALVEIKKNQAEGLFDVVGKNLCSVSVIAGFMHGMVKGIHHALYEIGDAIYLTCQRIAACFKPGTSRSQVRKEQREAVFQRIRQPKIDELKALAEKLREIRQVGMARRKSDFPDTYCTPITGWRKKTYSTPMDFASDVALALPYLLVNPGFEENPGIATPAFAAAIVSLSALTLPVSDDYGILKTFRAIPEYLAKTFMGKTLEGAYDINNALAVFLEWKLAYFGVEGASALYHGDFEFVRTMLENPEEITLGSVSFLAMGYAIGLIPDLPHLHLGHHDNVFLNAAQRYAEAVVNTGVGFINWVSEESRQAMHEAVMGPNTLELSFIGLKAALLMHTLISGAHKHAINTLEIDAEQLAKDFQTAGTQLFGEGIPTAQKEETVRKIFEQHGIAVEGSPVAEELVGVVMKKLQGMREADGRPEALLADTTQTDFTGARDHLKQRLQTVHLMEFFDSGVKREKSDTEYLSKTDAALMYDELFFAFEDYNALAPQDQKIDASVFLKHFYNKHCYEGSSGIKKLLSLTLFLPITLLWRGFKWLVGTPSMRHQVTKSNQKDKAMLFQLIADTAPLFRSLLKAMLYMFRMAVGAIVVITPLVIAVALSAVIVAVATSLFVPFAIVALLLGNARRYVSAISVYCKFVRDAVSTVWSGCLDNRVVNGWMRFISKYLGGIWSPHRSDAFGATGVKQWYAEKANVADTNTTELNSSLASVLRQLGGAGVKEMLAEATLAAGNDTPKRKKQDYGAANADAADHPQRSDKPNVDLKKPLLEEDREAVSASRSGCF